MIKAACCHIILFVLCVKSQSRSLADFSKRASAAMAAFFTVSSPSPEQVEVILAVFHDRFPYSVY